MKVQRYNVGRSNVGMLEQGRSALRSPAEVEKEKMAPYAAVAQVAGDVSEDLTKLQIAKNQVQDETDRLTTATSVKKVNTELAAARKQADQEKWTKDQFDTTVDFHFR